MSGSGNMPFLSLTAAPLPGLDFSRSCSCAKGLIFLTSACEIGVDVNRNCAFHLGKEDTSGALLGAVDDALCRENGQDLFWPLPCSSQRFHVKQKALLCHTCCLCCSFSLKGLLEK